MSQAPEERPKNMKEPLERTYFELIKDLKEKNISRYEELATRLSAGGEEFLNMPDGRYKISVDKNGCAYSFLMEDGKEFQRLGWTRLTDISTERIASITETLAECEARAALNA